MAAAYAALVSLLNTMDQIDNHPFLSTFLDEHLNKSLRGNVEFFLDFVENYSDVYGVEMKDLVGKIAFVAHAAEDMIERQVEYEIHVPSTDKSPSLLSDIKKIRQDMNSIKQKVLEFEEVVGEQPAYSKPTTPSSIAHPATAKTTMLGFDGYLIQLLDQLISYNSSRQILPIVGMGGIGKTTLARNVYESLHVVHHFDIRAWVTVSHEFSAREMVLQALSCLRRSTIEMDKSDNQPCEELELYKTLWGRRYLVVFDDVWSVDAWEKIMNFFPENNNGSRIVITTRQPEVVHYFGSSEIAVDFLDDKYSWELFCDKAFAQQGCPYLELEHVGKKIVQKCKGLPLAIVVIGGLLGKSYRTQEYWEKFAGDISLILNSGEGNQVLSILSLSYKHMPLHLRPCFLYLGLYPEDYRLDVSQLIKLWVAEGFIKPNTYQSLEETAESCMKELVDRRLLLVRDLRWNKKIKSCCVHDLVRDMCIRIAEKENFFCVERDIDGRRHYIVDERMQKFYPQQSHHTLKRHGLHRLDYSYPEVYSRFLFHESPHVGFHSVHRQTLVRTPTSSRSRSRSRSIIRVSDIHEMACPQGTFREINLRFLYHRYRFGYIQSIYSFPSSISQLWSLQTLMIEGALGEFIAPCQIWEMPQLRHIDIPEGVRLADPPHHDHDHDHHVIRNLQTLKKVRNLSFSEVICKRIPNIKELHIQYSHLGEGETGSLFQLQNIGGFIKLESLHYCWNKWARGGDRSLQSLKLPSSLKELTLENSCIAWSDVALVGSLPHHS